MSREVKLSTITSSSLGDESFSTSLCSNTITIKGKNSLSLGYGCTQVERALKSGFIIDTLGELSPKYPLRPLWISQTVATIFNSDFSIALPDRSVLEELCIEAIACGYNALVMGSLSVVGSDMPFSTDLFEESCNTIRRYGLKIILAPNFVGTLSCPNNDSFLDMLSPLKALMSYVDILFWQSLYDHPFFDDAQDSTCFELLVLEMKKLEKISTKPLIYYLPPVEHLLSKQSTWIQALQDVAGSAITLSFSAMNGPPKETHLAPHPLFTSLRSSQDVSSTPLLPIYSMGLEGYEHIFALSSFEKILPNLTKHPFAGMLIMTPSLPKRTTLLYGGLWLAGQSLWHRKNPHLLLENWLRSEQYSVYDMHKAIKEGEYVALEINSLKDLIRFRENIPHDSFRIHIEHLVSFLNHLYHKQILPPEFFSEVKPQLTYAASSLAVSIPTLFQESTSTANLLKNRIH